MFSKYIWITVFVFILIFITLIFIGRTALKLKLHYFGYLMGRTFSMEKTLMLGKTEGKRR